MHARSHAAWPVTPVVLMTLAALASPDAGAAADTPALGSDNPFARASTLPYELPPFDLIRDSDYRSAFLAGMAQQRAEVGAIAHDPQPPTFENTIVALERSGALLDRVSTTFFNLNTSNGSDAMRALETELAPLLAAHDDAIHMDPALFARIATLHAQRGAAGPDPQAQQLLQRYYLEFVRAGAQLSAADQDRLRSLNVELSTLTTQFRQNVLQATRDGAVVVSERAQLAGLSESQIGAAANAAAARGLAGQWLLPLQNTTTQPLLAQLRDRSLRERIYRASVTRASAGATDNRPVIARIVRLRAERAALLGFPSHAAYVLADETAGTPAAVDAMLRQIGGAALSAAHADAARIQRLIDETAAATRTAPFRLQPWDWQYYAEQLRRQRFAFDQQQVRPYFELDHVLQDGVFYVAHELYGLRFQERHDLPVYQPDVRVFEVFDADGTPLGLFLGDYYARDNKQGGAWMDNFVEQSQLLARRPVVVNNLNIPKPPPGSPTLLSFEEVTTLFHEFGHALHGLFSNVRYPTLAGTRVARDFVEYPSQFNEMWAREPAVVAHFAHHYRSGEPLPPALLAQIIAAQNFNEGYDTSEYIEAALIDQAWYGIAAAQAPDADGVARFEAAALEARGLGMAAVPPRYHSPYFLHIFADEYSADYYAYLWSEVLARDTGAWLHAHGGITRANGDILRARILSRGRTADAADLFREFYGGPPQVGPLLEYLGLQTR
jgi:peptidyl-dipeptidase Dcp